MSDRRRIFFPRYRQLRPRQNSTQGRISRGLRFDDGYGRCCWNYCRWNHCRWNYCRWNCWRWNYLEVGYPCPEPRRVLFVLFLPDQLRLPQNYLRLIDKVDSPPFPIGGALRRKHRNRAGSLRRPFLDCVNNIGACLTVLTRGD